ncbi:arginase [Paenibacillus turpanensis]|uniref:arginase n=1 Tax=Paenibacillus turpanensis TaxID=2689078 RepID=UPI00140A3FA1|nr:arginase [Paenibacillus turpanensis]
MKQMTISMIGVPMDLGADRRGVDMGPSALRCAHLQQRMEKLGYTFHDKGNLVVERPGDYGPEGEKLKYLPEIIKVSTELCRKVDAEIKQGAFPLVVGGDHSISIGTLKGILQHKKRLGVIWFDAHADVNIPETSPSGNIHGMPLAVAMGYGHPDLTGIGGQEAKLNPTDVVIVGARSVDEGERDFIRSKGVHIYTMHDIDRMGMTKVMEEAIAAVSKHTDGVHLSLDLDAIDPLDAPGVGTPVPGGVTYRESHLAMEMLADAGIITSAELVEVNPILDTMNRTAEVAVALAGSLFGEKIM